MRKSTSELLKDKKQGTPTEMCFLSFSNQISFLSIFERGNAPECWAHKVFRLGPASSGDFLSVKDFGLIITRILVFFRRKIFADKSC